MKDQYVADIGDYGKYSLLKAFSDAGVRVGINWYYTKDDGSNDGRFTPYLNEGYLKDCDPEVFNKLKKIIGTNNRSVKAVERNKVPGDAIYYHALMDFSGNAREQEMQRRTWMEKSLEKLALAELVFCDPDNGLLTGKGSRRRNREKYVLRSEIEQYYEHHNVVYYCHKGRRKPEAWEEYKAMMLMGLPSAHPIVLTYHKGTQRSYVFLVHPKYVDQYKAILKDFLERWTKAEHIFTMEDVCIQNHGAINRFATKWRNAFQKEQNLHKLFEAMDFSDEAGRIGFIMDAGHSFSEVFPEVRDMGDLNAIKKVVKRNDALMTPQLLGATIHSQWRYVNHWAMTPPNDADREWFVFMLDWLLRMTA